MEAILPFYRNGYDAGKDYSFLIEKAREAIRTGD